MSYSVIMMPRATNDLQAIYHFIAADSPKSADLVERQISGAIDSLQNLPHRVTVFRHNARPDRVVRRMVVSPYLIFFRIKESARQVSVIHIRHGARRPPGRF